MECLLLKQKWKNVPKRSEPWFKRRTSPEEQVLGYTIRYGNYVILLFFQSDIYIKVLALYVFAVGPWKEVR